MSSPDRVGSPDLEAVVEAAGRAPSIHNTQPWRWVARDGVLEVRADRDRQLHIADRDGHSLLISCGAAIELTELALAAQGWGVEAETLPDPDDPDLLARLRPVRHPLPGDLAQRRIEAALGRRSERRPFGPEPVAEDVVERLAEIGRSGGVYIHFPVRADENLDLAVAISQADRSGRDDPAYAAEVAAWVRSDDPASDGVPTSSIPRVSPDEPRHTDIPLRDFELGVAGGQLIEPGVDERPQIAVILTETDGALEQLRAGQAMMRLMVQAELEGIASCPLSQSVDLLAFRTRLRALMGWTGYPQMMLRLGARPGGEPARLTPRRPVAEVLTVE